MTGGAAQDAAERLRAQAIEKTREMTRVPLMGASGTRLLDLSRENPDKVNLSEVDGLISHDPALASRVLQVANSTYYSMRQEVTTVRQGIMTIGLHDLMSLVVVTSLMDRFKTASPLKNLDPVQFWMHSVAVGGAAKVGAGYCACSFLAPGEVSVAALLHDIGKGLFIRFFAEEYDTVIASAAENGRPLEEVEAETFGISHDELGGMLAARWKLPEFIGQIATHHHRPQDAERTYYDAVALVSWANSFVKREGIGNSGNAYYPPAEESAAFAPSENGSAKRPVGEALEPRRGEIVKAIAGSLGSMADTINPTGETQEEIEDKDKAREEAARARAEREDAVARPSQEKRGLFSRLVDFFRI
ncbi:MAG TPA: HDOD domain-containing protein [Sumerlaeia bacterium]|nr:HDOD domain-containing protein [Sumerlaeia bacterium]